MVRKICLDSDFIIQFLRNDKRAKEILESLSSVFFITSINVFEIWYGKKKLEPISEFFENLNKLDFDENAAILSAEILLNLKKWGEIIDNMDVFIAAICIKNN